MFNILIWSGIFVGGIVLAFLFKTTLFYWLWRVTGGVSRLVKENKAPSLPALLGLSNPHFMTVESTFVTLMPTPDFNEQLRVDLALSHEVSFTRGTSSNVENRDGVYPLDVTCRKVFPVNPKQVRHGCCRKYSLSKAAFLRTEVGGDPWCGGGIKHFWPPLSQEIKETLCLRNILGEQTIQAFVSEYCGGKHYSVFNFNFGIDNHPTGHLTLFVGDGNTVTAYAHQHKLQLRPLQVNFV